MNQVLSELTLRVKDQLLLDNSEMLFRNQLDCVTIRLSLYNGYLGMAYAEV